jgi:hypothetical protein
MDETAARVLLGVPDDATVAEVKSAFRRRARRAHPDKAAAGDGAAAEAEAVAAYGELTAARDALLAVPEHAPRGADEEQTLLLTPEDLLRKPTVCLEVTRRVVVCRRTGRAVEPRDLLGAACAPCGACAALVDIAGCAACKGTGQRLHEGRFRYETRTTRHALPLDPARTRGGTRWTLEGEGTMDPGRLPGDVVCVAQMVASDASGLGFVRAGDDDLVVVSRLVVTAAQAIAGLRVPLAHPDGTRRVLRTRPSQVPLDCGRRGALVSRCVAQGAGLPPDGDLVLYVECPKLPCDGPGVAAMSRELSAAVAEREGAVDAAAALGAPRGDDARELWLGVDPPVGRADDDEARVPLAAAPGGLAFDYSSGSDDESAPFLEPARAKRQRRGQCAQQ